MGCASCGKKYTGSVNASQRSPTVERSTVKRKPGYKPSYIIKKPVVPVVE